MDLLESIKHEVSNPFTLEYEIFGKGSIDAVLISKLVAFLLRAGGAYNVVKDGDKEVKKPIDSLEIWDSINSLDSLKGVSNVTREIIRAISPPWKGEVDEEAGKD